QNENSLLWWSTCGMSAENTGILRNLWADFLKQKYGSLEKARAAWQDYNPKPGDTWLPMDWDKGLPGMVHLWDFTRDGRAKKGLWPGFEECTADQLEFMARTMYKFNAGIVEYLRKELGCKQLVNCGNWRGVD